MAAALRRLGSALRSCVGAPGEGTLPADESFLLCPQELAQLAEGAGSGLVARLTCKFRSALKAPNAPPSASSPHHPDVERFSLEPSITEPFGPASDMYALADHNASSYAAVRCQFDPEEPLFWDAGTPQSGHDSDSDFSHQDDEEDGGGSSCDSSLTAGDADEMWDEHLLDHILQPLYSSAARQQQQQQEQQQQQGLGATTEATLPNAAARQVEDGGNAACGGGCTAHAEKPCSHSSCGRHDEHGGCVCSTPPSHSPPAHDTPQPQARLQQGKEEHLRQPAPLHVRRGTHSKLQLVDVTAARAGEASLLTVPALVLAMDAVCLRDSSCSWSLGSARDLWGSSGRAAHLSFYGSPTCPLHVWTSPDGSGVPSPCASPAFRSRSSPNASSATAVAAAAAAASCCLELSRAGLPRVQLQMAALGQSLISCSH